MTLSDLLHYLPAALTTFFGGGAAQIMMKVYSRRSDLRQVNTASDLNVATVGEKNAGISERLITQLQTDAEYHRTVVSDLQTKMDRLEDRAGTAQREYAAALRDASNENARLVSRVAELQTSLDIARGQIDEIQRRYPFGSSGGI